MTHSWNHSRIIPESVGPYARVGAPATRSLRRQETGIGDRNVSNFPFPTYAAREVAPGLATTAAAEAMR